MSVAKKYRRIVKEINRFDFSGLDDTDLSEIMNRLRAELSNGRSPENALPEVFAAIREVIDRRLGMWNLFDGDLDVGARRAVPLQEAYVIVEEKRKSVHDSQIHLGASFYRAVRQMRQPGDGLTFWPYDVQLMGALALYDGKIAEMGTGEGKTVVAVFPACLRALSGKKVHIATVNDYLALRDCTWMGPVFEFSGLSVDCILSHMPNAERKQAYKADIVYGNNYEFGFDYLRDNIKSRLEDRVQGKLDHVIIDEIDGILMDEATTPLIISGDSESHPGGYWKYKSTVELLLEKQSEMVKRLFCEMKAETNSQSKSMKLIQMVKADPWNAELLDYLSHNRDASKGMRAMQSKLAAARSEHKLEADLFYVVDEKLRTVNLTERGMALVEEKLGRGFMTLQIPPDPPLIKGGISSVPLIKGGMLSVPLTKRGRLPIPLLEGGTVKSPFVKGDSGGFLSTASPVDSPPAGRSEEVRNFLQLLRAYVLHRRDEDYIIHNGSIIIVDEFTGRLAFGKKYEEGLHQAIECKEGLQVTPENRVMGRITHPNYFRLYEKMSGMTATAHTEAEEFRRLYGLQVVRIPTNRPVIRVDLPDRFYRTEAEKLEAVIAEIEEYHNLGNPVLIGTRSVEKSEHLSALLAQRGIRHNTLNAKNHAREAEIIKSAGRPYAVTIATNMAGRGTDIVLGDPQLGLHVIGTERHTARRIDHQLIGRSGRQGDPGSSRFYLSLQDDLFRIFGREEMSALVKAFDRYDTGRMPALLKLVRRAQRKSEEMSYHVRRHLIEYDDIIDRQRRNIYAMRREILTDDWTKPRVQWLIADFVKDQGIGSRGQGSPPCSLEGLREYCLSNFGVRIPKLDAEMTPEEMQRSVVEAFKKTYQRQERLLGSDLSRRLARSAMLDALETGWADYLSFQSEFDRSFSLRSYVRSDPLTDYRMESSRLFDDLLASIRREAMRDIFTYPLPGEKMDSIRQTEGFKHMSKQIKDLLSIS